MAADHFQFMIEKALVGERVPYLKRDGTLLDELRKIVEYMYNVGAVSEQSAISEDILREFARDGFVDSEDRKSFMMIANLPLFGSSYEIWIQNGNNLGVRSKLWLRTDHPVVKAEIEYIEKKCKRPKYWHKILAARLTGEEPPVYLTSLGALRNEAREIIKVLYKLNAVDMATCVDEKRIAINANRKYSRSYKMKLLNSDLFCRYVLGTYTTIGYALDLNNPVVLDEIEKIKTRRKRQWEKQAST